jgi:ligand-binding sensor domain-containing protein
LKAGEPVPDCQEEIVPSDRGLWHDEKRFTPGHHTFSQSFQYSDRPDYNQLLVRLRLWEPDVAGESLYCTQRVYHFASAAFTAPLPSPTPTPSPSPATPPPPPVSPTPTPPPTAVLPTPAIAGWRNYTSLNNVGGVVFASKDELWAATTGGAVRWDLTTDTYTHFTAADGLASTYATDVALAPDGSLWFATIGGLSRFNGVVWFGGHQFIYQPPGGGLSRFDGTSWQYFTFEDGLPSNDVRALAAGADGALWVGAGCGVARFDGRAWQTMAECGDLGPGNVNAVTAGPGGVVWVGTDAGLTCFDGQGVTTYDKDPSRGISSLAVAPDGTVWMGRWQVTGGGVVRFDGTSWTAYTDGLPESNVTAVAVTPGGVVWAGTYQHGLGRLEGQTWTVYTVADGLPSDYINVLTIAPDGVLWVGTKEGLARFDGETWAVLTSADGLVSGDVLALTVAPDGALWVGTSFGATRIQLAD